MSFFDSAVLKQLQRAGYAVRQLAPEELEGLQKVFKKKVLSATIATKNNAASVSIVFGD